MRQIVLDTETTGIGEGHRIIEIGAVEIVNRKLTGRHYHQYIHPQRDNDAEAEAVHGISIAMLEEMNAPIFNEIADEFCEFIRGGQLVIHNAAFDVGMMDQEFKRLQYPKTESFCTVLDTLALARDMHPGSRVSLDSLCNRYGIDNSHRTLHGALLDAEILADVYLMMTGGQTDLTLMVEEEKNENSNELLQVDAGILSAYEGKVILASESESQSHEEFLDLLDKKSSKAVWRIES